MLVNLGVDWISRELQIGLGLNRVPFSLPNDIGIGTAGTSSTQNMSLWQGSITSLLFGRYEAFCPYLLELVFATDHHCTMIQDLALHSPYFTCGINPNSSYSLSAKFLN